MWLTEFIGTHLGLDENCDLHGKFVLDLVHNLMNAVSTSPGMRRAYEQDQWRKVKQTAAVQHCPA